MKKIVVIFILIRHGINPFKATSKTTTLVRQRFTDKEKEYLINRAENENTKDFLHLIMYGKAR